VRAPALDPTGGGSEETFRKERAWLPPYLEYDRTGDILYLNKIPPDPQQESEEIDYWVIARLSQETKEIEKWRPSSTRVSSNEGLNLPLIVELGLPERP
jgi:hypothetical protein